MRRRSLQRPPDHRSKHNSTKKPKKFSDRNITWEEQQELGKRYPEFLEVGEGNWPVDKIIKEDIQSNDTKWYYIQWAAHPETGEEFKPVWRVEADIAEPVLAEWRSERSNKHKELQVNQESQQSKKVRRTRWIIPDSSAEEAAVTASAVTEDRAPRLLQTGLTSSNCVQSETQGSDVEIIETQQQSIYPQLEVSLPPLSQDRAHWETLASSQLSADHDLSLLTDYLLEHTSQDSGLQISAGAPHVRSAHPSPHTASYIADADYCDFDPETRVAHFQDSQTKRCIQNTPSPCSDRVQSDIQTWLQLPNLQLLSRERIVDPLVSIPATYSNQLPQAPGTAATKTPDGFSSFTSNKQVTKLSLNRPEDGTGSLSQFTVDRLSSSQFSMEEHNPAQSSPARDHNSIPNGHVILNTEAQDHATDAAPVPISFTIQESIEREDPVAGQPPPDLTERTSSSQASLEQEHQVETVDGITIPTRPILGANEYAIPLTAEGRVISVYKDTIKAKEKAILRFIRRKGSPGSSSISNKKTTERIEMQHMLSRLNDITTHLDLGLPGLQTQHSLSSQEESAYANYAGSKFVMLGALIDRFKDTGRSIVVIAQGGALRDMLLQYLRMKHVLASEDTTTDTQLSSQTSSRLVVDLLDSQANQPQSLPRKPLFIIAFDASFSFASEQVRRIREQYDHNLPILHFLVVNSSEHVEKCVPESMTSNIRLKVVVRTTYLAADHLGGPLTYFQSDTDLPKDGSMPGMGEYQRGLVKSPARKMAAMADAIHQAAMVDNFLIWEVPSMPELELDVLHEARSVTGRGGTRTPLARGHTPASRVGTPSRKRMLDVDNELTAKRLRMTPIRDAFEQSNGETNHKSALLQIQKDLDEARAALAQETAARILVENRVSAAEAQSQEWRENFADLQRRYEKRRSEQLQLEKENKKLTKDVQNMSSRNDKVQEEKTTLKAQIAELKKDLASARSDLINAGGDTALLEQARAEARAASEAKTALEKSLASTKETSEYIRLQYQSASDRARDLAHENQQLEEKSQHLEKRAAELPRQLKAMNYQAAVAQYIRAGEQMQYEVRARNALIRKIHEENTVLKGKRGVQTRGSSVQPAGSPGPGLGAGLSGGQASGTRSRQNSPAAYGSHLTPVVAGSRTSVLRHGG